MSTTINAAVPIAPATAIITRLWAQGYRPGAPVHLDDATLLADTASWEAGECPRCGKPGLSFEPWHRGTAYKGLVSCRHCLAYAEEA